MTPTRQLKYSFGLSLSLLGCLFIIASGPKDEEDNKIQITVVAQGQIGTDQEFVQIGRSLRTNARDALKEHGGFDSLYRRFLLERSATSSADISQEAIHFQSFLRQYDERIQVSLADLESELAFKGLFSSRNETELNHFISEIKGFEYADKLAFFQRVGNRLLSGYDLSRINNGPNTDGIVTCMDMIKAYNAKGKAGVCRDMAQCLANMMSKTGLDAIIATGSVIDGGHAVVIVQNPENRAMTNILNYDYLTSSEGTSSLSHLRVESNNQMFGINMDLYDADGKPLTSLPTSFGAALYELTGGNVADLDPMLESESDILHAEMLIDKNHSIGGGIAHTVEGHTILGIRGTADYRSKNLDNKYTLLLYKSDQDRQLVGPVESVGVYLTGYTKIKTNNWKLETANGGVLQSRMIGQVDLRAQYQKTKHDYKSGTVVDSNIGFKVGNETEFISANEMTRIAGKIAAGIGVLKNDVRDESLKEIGPYLKDVTVALLVSQKLNDKLGLLVGGTYIHRRGALGAQAKQEVGVSYQITDDGEVVLVLGHEGQVSGDKHAYIPGSLERVSAKLAYNDARGFTIGTGAYCMRENIKDCSVRVYSGAKF